VFPYFFANFKALTTPALRTGSPKINHLAARGRHPSTGGEY